MLALLLFLTVNMPFGGVGESGCEHIDTYSSLVAILIQPSGCRWATSASLWLRIMFERPSLR